MGASPSKKSKSKNTIPKEPESNNIPHEVITLVVGYLPIKSLVRFKCVSKTWNDIIDNYSLFQSNNNNNMMAIFNEFSYIEAKELINSHDPSNVISRFYLPPHHCEHSMNDDYDDSKRRVRIVGSCNGIVAIAQYCFDTVTILPSGEVDYRYETVDCCFKVYLWNPLFKTRSLIITPPANLPFRYSFFVFGFGVDACHNDYKIVYVANDFPNLYVGGTKRILLVYSSKHDSWGLPYVVDDVQDSFKQQKHGVLIMNNNRSVLHWIFYDYQSNEIHSLRGFDLCSEKWTDLPLPDVSRDLIEDDDLHALDGCLCVIVSGSYMWIMKEYGVKDSWAPFFNVSEINIINHLPLLPSPKIIATFSKDLLLLVHSIDSNNHQLCPRLPPQPNIYNRRKKLRWFNLRHKREPEPEPEPVYKFKWFNLWDKTVIKFSARDLGDIIACVPSFVPVPNGVDVA